MATLQTAYRMAFMPEKMENNMLMSACRMAVDRLASKDKMFAQRMNMRGPNTRIAFSNQLYHPTMHTRAAHAVCFGWLRNENVSSDLRIGDNFFPYGLRDPQGKENYILFYFDFN